MTEYNEQSTPAIAANDVQAKINKEHLDNIVGGLLSAISPEQRVCVALRNIEGLSYQEIAAILKININTVRSRLKRAREKLLTLRRQVDHGQL